MVGAGLIDALVGVGAEVVALALDEGGGKPVDAETVVVGQGGREYGDGLADLGGQGDDATPGIDEAGEFGLEIGVKKEGRQFGIGVVGLDDAIEEFRADDAAATPDGGEVAGVNIPIVVGGAGGDFVEPLGVGHEFRGVEGAANVFDKGVAVDAEFGKSGEGAGGQVADGGLALVRGPGEGAGEDGFADAGDGNPKVEGGFDGPAAGAFLAGGVNNEVDEGFAGFGIHLGEHLGRDVDEVGVEVAGVPGAEDLGDFGGGHAGAVAEELIGFTDDLHVGVFDAVVHHFDEVAGTVGADVGDAGDTVDVGGDGFEEGP